MFLAQCIDVVTDGTP